jgi:DNA polymerase-1
MLFLRNPYAESYALKPSAEIILKMRPEERDKVLDWLLEHQPVEGRKLSKSPKSDNYAGAWICKAPASLVGPYCVGDVVRTYKLAMKVGAHLEKYEMVDAYRREIELIPVILDMEREGVRVDVKALERDAKSYGRIMLRLDDWIRRRLRCGGLNIDSGPELAKALMATHLAAAEDLGVTPTGQTCTAKDALQSAINDPQVAAVLRYRGAVMTCLTTFIHPWLAASKKTGRIYAQWHTTRRDHKGGIGGARTGRIQPTPNLSNIPKTFKPIFKSHTNKSALRKILPKAPLLLPPPPLVRSYVLPDEGHVLIDRDFSQQELRVLAYFENDVLAEAYRKNPDTDLHQKAADILGVDRYKGKTLNLSILYGMGLGLLAERLGCSVDEAKAHKAAYFRAFYSVKEFLRSVSQAAKAGHPVSTWGGRKYYPPSPKIINGRLQTFEYVLPNYLIQGSASDLTKAVMIEYRRRVLAEKLEARIRLSVHDELGVSALKAHAARAMALLKEVMAMPRLDVPMTSTGKIGPNWAAMKECA